MIPQFPEGTTFETFPPPPEEETQRWGKEACNREYWRDGPWQNEPDKVVWVDPLTDLDCMIIRNQSGVLCGYVGVPEAHPWHGIHYSGCVNRHAPRTFEEDKAKAQTWYDEAKATVEADPSGANKASFNLAELSLKPYLEPDKYSSWVGMKHWDCLDYNREDRCQSPESLIEVHGGITYSNSCQEGRKICHTPKTGRSEHVWWYGFDCGHCMDFSPGMDASSRSLRERGFLNEFDDEHATYDPTTGTKHEYGDDFTYRDMAYAKAEVERMAQQLTGFGNETHQ